MKIVNARTNIFIFKILFWGICISFLFISKASADIVPSENPIAWGDTIGYPPKVLTIYNKGRTDLKIGRISLTGEYANEFSFTPLKDNVIPPFGFTQTTVSFTGSWDEKNAYHKASLLISSNDRIMPTLEILLVAPVTCPSCSGPDPLVIGTVTDTSGAAIGNAKIIRTNLDTSTTYSAVFTHPDNGCYITSIAQGTNYRLQVSASGYYSKSINLILVSSALYRQDFQLTPIDTTAPTPNPMTWSSEPYETSTSSISMTAATASDSSTPITYYFDYYSSPTGGSGGTDSGWTANTSYTDAGLGANHQYGYRVSARDGNSNATSYSAVSYDFTDIETPSGISFGAVSTSSIQARSINTPSGLTRGSSGLIVYNDTRGTNSGWMTNNNYWTSSSLNPNTQYGFRAKARNGDTNETGYSSTYSKYTLANQPGISSFSEVSPNSIRANWSSNGNPAGTMYYCENTTHGTNSGWTSNHYWVSSGLTCGSSYTFRVKARNNDGIETGWVSLGSQNSLVCADTTAPTPNPMTWSSEPYETSTSSISMTAATASDSSTPIAYYFDYYSSPTGGSGGTDSGWTANTSYIDVGLGANHQYGYRVSARDGNSNATSYSAVSYDYTDIETPSGISFGTVSTSSIQARSINTPSGLTRGSSGLIVYNDTSGTNSGWKTNNNYWTSSSLNPNTQYGFRTKARNGDANETGYSSTYSKYTLANQPGASSFSDVNPNSIRANWASNGNPAGTMYYCENTTHGTNSGWTSNHYWVSSGLTCGSSYTFRVKARNNDGIETGWVGLGSQNALVCPDTDSDGDGLLNTVEEVACTDPFDPDSDNDGLTDGNEDTNYNGILDPGETDPCDNDSDNDGKLDGSDTFPNNPNEWSDSDSDGTGDNADSDDDNDGISDVIESSSPNSGDANNDGIQDKLQNNVVSLKSYTAQGYVVLETPPGTYLSNCQTTDNPSPSDAPADINFDYGFFDFTINGLISGGATSLTMTLPNGATPDTYYKYGQTPANLNDHWYEFMYDGQTGAEINGNVIILHFTDALRGDDVLLKDMMAIDLGGPGIVITADDLEPLATITSPAKNKTIANGGSIIFIGSASSGNPPLTYSWDFNGGANNSTLLEPGDVIFDKVGIYNITFTVTDNDGDISSDTVTITVNEPSDVDKDDGGGGGGGGGCFISIVSQLE